MPDLVITFFSIVINIFLGSLTRNCLVDQEQQSNLTRPIFRETGDIAEINEKGLFYRYRKNRVIKRFGHRIVLTKVEALITKTTGLPNRCIWIKDLNKLVIYVVIENFTYNQEEKILDKLRVKLLNVLSQESFPDHLSIINTLPVTSHGKIDDKTLEKNYVIFNQKKDIDSTASSTIFSSLCTKYLGLNFETLSEIEGQTFLELGGTSITILQLTNELKGILGSNYPDDFMKLLFQQTIKECLIFLKNYKNEKRKVDSQMVVPNKKIKHNEDFNVLWKYDLKACVDSSPVVFRKK